MNFKIHSVVTLLPLLLALAGCGGQSNHSIADQAPSANIVGGQALGARTELASSTVLVISIQGQSQMALCTGTLVDANVVLTAAHCAIPGSRTTIAFTTQIDFAFKKGNRVDRAVDKAQVHPLYQRGLDTVANAAHDLALLHFVGSAPRWYKSRQLPSPQFVPSAQDEIVMSGFGLTSGSANDSGLLRYTTAPISRLRTQLTTGLHGPDQKLTDTWVVDQRTNGVCEGDSGGPLYIETPHGLVLIGVTSMGVNSSRGELDICRGVSLYADLRGQFAWISESISQLR